MSLVDLGTLSEFGEAVATSRVVGSRKLVLIRLGESVYVLDDRCSHEDFPLSLGEVDADTCEIECERHGAMFSLKDGSPLSLPATRPVATYDVVIRDGRIFVELA